MRPMGTRLSDQERAYTPSRHVMMSGKGHFARSANDGRANVAREGVWHVMY